MSAPSNPTALLDEVKRRLEAGSGSLESLLSALDAVLEGFAGSVGTIHALPEGSSVLELRAQRGIPPSILEKVSRVPVGKGMAGLAAERREPVQVCNLQTDSSGVARPAARETGMRGSIALPMLAGGAVLGVLGVGKGAEHEFGPEEIALLERLAALFAGHLACYPADGPTVSCPPSG